MHLNECQQSPNFKNLLHHACQVTCEEKHGYEGEIKLRYKDCVDSMFNNINLHRSNVKSCQNEYQSIASASKNLDPSFKKACQHGNVPINLDASFKEVYQGSNE